MFRNLWENFRQDMPKKGRSQGAELDPLKLPTRLQTALPPSLAPKGNAVAHFPRPFLGSSW